MSASLLCRERSLQSYTKGRPLGDEFTKTFLKCHMPPWVCPSSPPLGLNIDKHSFISNLSYDMTNIYHTKKGKNEKKRKMWKTGHLHWMEEELVIKSWRIHPSFCNEGLFLQSECFTCVYYSFRLTGNPFSDILGHSAGKFNGLRFPLVVRH